MAGRGGAGEGHEAAAAGGDPAGAGPRGGGERVARNTAIFSILTAFSRVAGLGREILAASYFGTCGPASAFTLANLVPNLDRQPLRPGGALGRVRAGVHRPAPAGPPPRGVPAGVHALLDHADRARRDHRLLRDRRRGDHAAVHRPHLRRGARHPHRGALAGAVPRRAAARADRPAGGDLAVLRTLHDPRARARGVEHRDHRRAGAAAPRLPRRRRDLRLRDRHRDRHRRAVRDGARGARADRLPPAVLDRLARPAHPPGVHPDAPRHDRPGDRQPRPVHQRRLRHARQQRSPAGDRKRVPRVHAPAGDLQRGGRHRAVPHPQPHGLAPRPRRDAPRGGGGDAPDQPAADPRRRVHHRAHDPDRAAALRTRANSTPHRPTSSRSRCSGLRSRCPSGGSTCC